MIMDISYFTVNMFPNTSKTAIIPLLNVCNNFYRMYNIAYIWYITVTVALVST